MIQGVSRTTAVVEIPKAVTRVLAQEEQNLLLRNIITKEHPRAGRKRCQKMMAVQEDIKSQGHVKTYDGSKDPEDHLKIFQAAAKVERWAIPTWCHIFNSILTGFARVWFDDLPPESVDSYNDLKKAFLENFLQQKKCIKDPVEIHHIKHKEGESTEDFMRRFKIESRDVKGAPKIMRISGFMHGITNSELIKCLHNKIPKSVDKMMRLWQRVARQRITQSFSPDPEISFPPLEEEEGTERPMIIEAEIGGHFIHHIYVDGGTRRTTSSHQSSRKRKNQDVFTWKPANMTGVLRHIAKHRLNVREGCPLVWQKKRGQAVNKNQAIQEEVEKLVDADAYKGYHQIKMAKEDEEKTTFITTQGIFCYFKMPFGLRNAGATYQRLVDKAFHKQIDKNLEVYMIDLVIKIRTKDEIIRDIEETFKTLREINMKLNPEKCTFGVEEGVFLGYKVNTKGINVCPNKADAVLSLSSPKCLKDVQKLNGKLASLNRFLAKSAEKSLPFFKTLKKCTKKSDFHWTKEAESAFKQMKQLIAKLLMLTAPEEKEELIVNLAAAKEAPHLERSISKLHINGKVSPGTSTCQQASKNILPSTPNYSGHGPTHKASAVKTRIDFIVERPEEDSPNTPMEVEEELSEPWILFTDRSSCVDGSGARLILTNPEGTKFTYALRFRFEATNNEAEYEALIAGLRIAK
ncbi:reverse transcriptase domain-containing protein [Tanacetum coccineum]